TSNMQRNYSFTDVPGKSGVYEYRLIDYALDGERTVHDAKTVNVLEASSANFSAGANAPNPFTQKTAIPVTLASDALVRVEVTDILGRKMIAAYSAMLSSGTHQIIIDGSELATGSYYSRITITDPQSGNVLWTSPKAMLMQVVK